MSNGRKENRGEGRNIKERKREEPPPKKKTIRQEGKERKIEMA